MNKSMLKYLVHLSNPESGYVDTTIFFNKYPKNNANLTDLNYLRRLGYITMLYADDEIYVIGVNQKAVDIVN